MSNEAPLEETERHDLGGSRNSPASASTPENISELLSHFVEVTEGEEKIRIVDLLNSLDSRSHGPMLLFPAIVAISPIGMIPGMSTITGTLIILIAAQMMMFSGRPWIPKRLEEFQFSRDKLTSGVSKIEPWINWFEKAVRHRYDFLTHGVLIYPIGICSILMAVAFFPLAFIPFGVVAPGFAITMFGLGLTARDGLLVAFGFSLTGVAVAVLWATWTN